MCVRACLQFTQELCLLFGTVSGFVLTRTIEILRASQCVFVNVLRIEIELWP